jgi:plastocyanin
MRNLPLAGALMAILLGAPVLGRAAAIEGMVTLTPADLSFRGGTHPNAYIGQVSGSAGHPGAADPSDTTYGVAYLADGVDAGGSPAEPALLDQKGQRFIPRILAVVVGQSVDFRNSDNVFHNVFSYSPPKRFDLGRYPRGKSKRLTFQKPGMVQVFCDIHSDMRADIVVVPSRRFGYVDAQGHFRIDDAPAGKHTVVVWLPRRGERSGEVDVPGSGTADFAMGAE